MIMEDILFLYGSGRTSATRTQRFGKFPREQQTRVGPWIVRPTRTVAVRRELLARYQEELVLKVTNGTVQLKLKDGSVVPLEDIPALFSDVAPDYSAMDDAQLLDLLRGEAPSVAILRALMQKIPVEGRREAGTGLRDVIQRLAETEHKEFQKLIDDLDNEENEYRDKMHAEEEERIAAEAAEQQARVDSEKAAAADAAAKEAAQKASTLPAPPEVDDADKMDFSLPKPAETTVTVSDEKPIEVGSDDGSTPVADGEQVKAHLDEVVDAMSTAPATTAADGLPQPEREEQVITTNDVGLLDEVLETPEQAADADAKAAEGRVLPEGWRNLSNTKMTELIGEKGITMPEKKNKTELTKALEAWLAGS